MMNVVYKANIFLFVAFLFTAISCSKDGGLDIEPETYDVIVEGFSFNNESEGGGLKAVDINRQTGNIDESLNTPKNVGGYTVNVYSPSGAATPYISEEFNFVDGGGEEYGVISNVKKGVNRFVAESVRNKDLFENKYDVGGYFNNGWVNLWGSVAKQWEFNPDDRLTSYKDILEEYLPCYTIYRGEKDYNVIGGQDNSVPFEMQAVNGRMLVVVENNTSKNVEVSYNGRIDQLGVDEALFVLLNDDSEVDIKMKFNIKYKKKQGKKEKTKNKRITYTLEPGKNKARLIDVQSNL